MNVQDAGYVRVFYDEEAGDALCVHACERFVRQIFRVRCAWGAVHHVACGAVMEAACEGAAKDDTYKMTAERAAPPPDYYADATLFKQRLQRDIERKAAVLSRLKTPAQ